ncbi:MAG TPA: DUF488 domain-containing protein [Nocardioidaceae bacterium]|nr:DUF488 domain-containing protein [Nocardioidaceae bacterium]
MPERVLLTVGHGRLEETALGSLLRDASVELLVDVRRFPGSRANPAVSRDALARWLPEAGVDYRWEERLGGRRSRPRGDDEDPWWQVEAFRAYAAHTRTDEFGAAMCRLLEEVSARRVAVMCSESVWWRCHRRIIADVAVVGHGLEVRHLMHDGRLTEHRPADGARVRSDGLVVWDRV